MSEEWVEDVIDTVEFGFIKRMVGIVTSGFVGKIVNACDSTRGVMFIAILVRERGSK